MTGKQLKNSILQWAIQGKLVPQDPNDEPASVLLEKIRAEKARLVKEKKIKKDKNESIIYRGEDNSYYEKLADGTVKCIDDEIPFEIPSSWTWIRLGYIVDFSKSSSVKTESLTPDTWVLDLEDIEKDSGKILNKKRLATTIAKSDKHPFQKGNVLYSKLRPYLNKVVIADEDGVCTSEILVFDFRNIDNKYAQYYLMSQYFVDYAMRDAYGVKMPRLGSKQGNAALMPLPPTAEQYRICSKLDVLLGLSSKYQAFSENLKTLDSSLLSKIKQSILQEAIQGKLVPQIASEGTAESLLEEIRAEKERLIKEKKIKRDKLDSVIFKGDDNKYYEKVGKNTICIDDDIPFEIPTSWCWTRMGVIGDWGAGATPQRGNPEYYNGNILWLKTGELNNGIVSDTQEKITEKALQECSLRLNKIGDILIAMYGATIGKLAIVGRELTTNQACCGCTPFIVYNKFLFYFLMANKTEFIKQGEGGAQPNISRIKLVKTLMPLPPLQEQKRIVSQLEDLFKLIKQ